MRNFLTLGGIGEVKIVEKKSAFLGHAAPLQNEKDALQVLEGVKKRLYDAKHHAFAYQIGENNEIQRANDGGEPSGTAGLPILNMIKKEQLKNVIVVVSRYFGGILLGTGGLVRAYGNTAHQAIYAAGIVEQVFGQEIVVNFGYNLLGKVQNLLIKEGVLIKDVLYSDKVQIKFFVNFDQTDRIMKGINEICNGSEKIIFNNPEFITRQRE